MILEAKGLGKVFSGKRALEGVSLEVKKGDILGVIGSSGAGKSTLLRCLSSLESEFEGEVNFYGKPFSFLDKKALRGERRRLGMIFQHFHLLQSRNVEENVSLPLELNGEEGKERVKELLSLVGLQGKEKCFISKLSGGEKQRVAIARALAQNPEVLFCDEATSSLDPKTTGEILDLLQKLNKDLGLTLVLITHEMDVVRRICNKVAVMSLGRVVECGTSLEVFSSPKDEVTKGLMQNSTHRLDLGPLREKEPEALFLTLHFKGEAAKSPILSSMIKGLKIEVNILAGWIDQIDGISIGSLTIGVKGQERTKVFSFLEEHEVSYEVLGGNLLR